MKRAALLCLLALACPAWASAPLVKGRFKLTDARDGRPVTQDSYKGKLQLVFFGFTRCRATCPRGLEKMSRALALLKGSQAEEVAALFISLDPERDSARDLKAYAANFSPRIVPLTGTPKALAAARKSFRLEAQKVGQGGEDYQLEHPAIYYLMDRRGRFLETLSVWDEAPALAGRLRKALEQP